MIIPLPCPFCGGEPFIMPAQDTCRCSDRGCAGGNFVTVDSWNKRSTPELDTAFDQFKASLEAERQRGDELLEMCKRLYGVNIELSGGSRALVIELLKNQQQGDLALNTWLALETIVKKYEV